MEMSQRYDNRMKRAEVELPEPLFTEVEGAARRLHMTIPQFLQKAAEKAVAAEEFTKSTTKPWTFPEPVDLGETLAPFEDWRILANESEEL